MNLRRKKPHDSLYMLLDTMCDAFGGIILLAVLVVLLTSEERNQNAASSETQEMLQRRLALAQTNLQESLQLSASLQARIDAGGWRQQEELLASRKKLRDQLQQTRDAVARGGQELDATAAADPSERLKRIEAQLADAQAQKLDAQNRLAAVEENSKRLQQRRSALEQQVIVKFNESQRPLRLPREYQTGKRVSYFIARYGRIYPCRNADLSRNETDLTWTSKMDDESVQPIPGKGIDPANARELQNYFDSQSKDEIYAAFCVFEDSFPAFIRARQLAAASGFAFGWEPFRLQDGPVTFSSRGHRPKPQ
jgi:hypothetical protein